MAQNRVDLVNIFSTITQTLAQNQQSLNQTDEYNHDHGSNMVQTFQTITDALQQKQGKPASSALSYAAKKLANASTSSSGQLYAQGLSQAAEKLKGKQIDSKGALDLLQSLISGGQSPTQSTGGDIMGTILGQLTGGATSQPSDTSGQTEDPMSAIIGQLLGGSQAQSTTSVQPESSSTSQSGGDLIGNLLSGLSGSQPSGTTSGSGLDLGDLLNAGMSFMQAKQHGGNTAEALIQAFMSASGMGNAAHRTQSTSLVINSFLQALGTAGTTQ
jgi:hypothetical protein